MVVMVSPVADDVGGLEVVVVVEMYEREEDGNEDDVDVGNVVWKNANEDCVGVAVVVVVRKCVVVVGGNVGNGCGGDDDVVVVFELMLLVLPRRAPEINASAITTSPGPGRILTSGSAVLAWCRPA